MAHVRFQPRMYRGYAIFPMVQIQFFMSGKDMYDYLRSDNGHFRFYDKYFWVNPKTFMLESFATSADAKNAVDLIVDGSN